jgi:PST family polysaccharide transporter
LQEVRPEEAELGIADLRANLGRRSVQGGTLVFAAQAMKACIQIGAVIVLARLLPPSAFGLIAIVAAVASTMDLARDLGLSTVTIQKSGVSHDQVSALFWINAGLGIAFAASLVLAAPLLASAFGQPELAEVSRWVSLSFVLSGFATQHGAILRRRMRFGAVALMEAGGEILALVLAIGLALAGAGLWSLVAQRLTPPAVSLAASWHLCRWRPGPPRLTAGIGSLLKSGASIAGTNVASTLARTIDQILVGWMWGPSALGLYERAVRLLMVPVNNISVPLYSVGVPALSRLGGQDRAYRQAFLKVVARLSLVTIPGGCAVLVTADWVVAVLFGARWLDAAPVVALFGIAATYQPVMFALGLLYVPLDRGLALFRATLIDSALLVLSVLCGLPFGIAGVAASTVGIGLLVRLPVAVWLATRAGPVRQGDIYLALLIPLAAGATTGALLIALRECVLDDGRFGSAAMGLALAAVAAVGAFVLCLSRTPRAREARQWLNASS